MRVTEEEPGSLCLASSAFSSRTWVSTSERSFAAAQDDRVWDGGGEGNVRKRDRTKGHGCRLQDDDVNVVFREVRA